MTMSTHLKISTGQLSDKGRKDINQDYHGLFIPQQPQLSTKGIAIALADGISSSSISQEASAAAVEGFLQDYYCTSDAWTVKTSVQRVLYAINSWLYAQSRQTQFRYNLDKGYVCTFTTLVIKSTTAHIFHTGDSRVYRLQGERLEQLTEDHRLWVSNEKSYLSRALGAKQNLEIDYQRVALQTGDVFVLATDGIYEYAHDTFITKTINTYHDNLDQAAQIILDEAYQKGSIDNLTIQIIRIDALPDHDVDEIYQHLTTLPFPPKLEARMEFDGYEIIREIYISSRSHVYLALDKSHNTHVIIKTPSMDIRENTAYLERFLMEEWIARRINNSHVLKPCLQTAKRNYLYVVTEYIEGQTLAQWMRDNPNPDIETVRKIVEQIAKGLQAFHRQEMLHQDIRPNNIMIDQNGTAKIIDFGSTRVAGIQEQNSPFEQQHILGTALYTAPEYFLGEAGTPRSDMFSLGVMTYQMLSGRLPYGTEIAKARTKAAQMKLSYRSVLDDEREIPFWIDAVLKKALHPNPNKRHEALSEFVYELRHPDNINLEGSISPFIERKPVTFWKSTSFVLALIIVVLIIKLEAIN